MQHPNTREEKNSARLGTPAQILWLDKSQRATSRVNRKMPLHIIGIDGGLKGGIASLATEDARFEPRLTAFYMPTRAIKVSKKDRDRVDGDALRVLFESLRSAHGHPDMLYLEEAVGVRGQSAARAASFGVSVGIVEGVALALNIPVTLVKAVVWKRHPEIGLIGETKATSQALASLMFPEALREFRRAEDDGVAEAALIAFYGWLMERKRHG
ncbi:MAG: hypothetical protein KGL39_03430 [Patescibacteria group bacterium]|nr:hypothetical protein [Patescibacteria group bacterium]